MDEDDVYVYCQRCGRPGARVAYGWTLLCKKCKRDDDDEWYEDSDEARCTVPIPTSPATDLSGV